MTTAHYELLVLMLIGFGLWIAFAYVFGRVWSARHNAKRRAQYRRRSAYRNWKR